MKVGSNAEWHSAGSVSIPLAGITELLMKTHPFSSFPVIYLKVHQEFLSLSGVIGARVARSVFVMATVLALTLALFQQAQADSFVMAGTLAVPRGGRALHETFGYERVRVGSGHDEYFLDFAPMRNRHVHWQRAENSLAPAGGTCLLTELWDIAKAKTTLRNA